MKRVLFATLAVGSLLWGASEDLFGQKVDTSFELEMQKAKALRLPYSDNYAPKKSVNILFEMVKEKADYYRGHYNLALAYYELKEYAKSKESFNKALEIRQRLKIEDATIFNAAGWVAMQLQDYKRAQELFLQGVALKHLNTQSSNATLFGNLGQLYFYMQRFNEALKYLTIAKEQYGSTSVQTTIESIKEIQSKKKQK